MDENRNSPIFSPTGVENGFNDTPKIVAILFFVVRIRLGKVNNILKHNKILMGTSVQLYYYSKSNL